MWRSAAGNKVLGVEPPFEPVDPQKLLGPPLDCGSRLFVVPCGRLAEELVARVSTQTGHLDQLADGHEANQHFSDEVNLYDRNHSLDL